MKGEDASEGNQGKERKMGWDVRGGRDEKVVLPSSQTPWSSSPLVTAVRYVG